ncbi:MAG: ACT domain-containing protein [Cyanobacteria bacterium]|nr:ACT domain-containing protein [Cyanobacteriota bacterium]
MFLGTEDTPGALVQVLNLFKDQRLNLTKIESRPSRKQFGDYVFYLDVAADLTDPQYHSFLEAVKAATPVLRVIGSYGCLGCLTP